MNKEIKKKAVAFTYGADEVIKLLKKHFCVKKLRIIGLREGGLEVASGSSREVLDDDSVANAFGGVGGYFVGNEYVQPRVEWVKDGKNVTALRVWKELLTWDEFKTAMSEHNRGFADKGNPEVWTGVVVYSPSASGWRRWLWDCELEDRAYSCHSTGEIFLEEDPSAGLCRHPHCVMRPLRGDGNHCGGTLLRPNYGWVVDYCYIVED